MMPKNPRRLEKSRDLKREPISCRRSEVNGACLKKRVRYKKRKKRKRLSVKNGRWSVHKENRSERSQWVEAQLGKKAKKSWKTWRNVPTNRRCPEERRCPKNESSRVSKEPIVESFGKIKNVPKKVARPKETKECMTPRLMNKRERRFVISNQFFVVPLHCIVIVPYHTIPYHTIPYHTNNTVHRKEEAQYYCVDSGFCVRLGFMWYTRTENLLLSSLLLVLLLFGKLRSAFLPQLSFVLPQIRGFCVFCTIFLTLWAWVIKQLQVMSFVPLKASKNDHTGIQKYNRIVVGGS